jgi:formylglycine-generating enzyme required for sulfatase activity
VLLGERPVRWLGAGLLAAGLLLPWLILLWRAAEPPLPPGGAGPVTVRPELVALPAGSFVMGSPADEAGRDEDERAHEVRITRPFVVSRTEVTQGQFAAVMGEGKLYSGNDDFGRPCREAGVGADLPVVCVTWREAVAFCNRLSELEGLTPVYLVRGDEVEWPDRGADGYRLPTEAEWEYAARAGTRTVWVGTDSEAEACRYANVADEAAKAETPDWDTFDCSDGYPRLSPVTAKEVNRWHLHGLGGNAAEWVWEWYAEYPEEPVPTVDPTGPPGGSNRVIRGGSWGFAPRIARAAVRYWFSPGLRDGDVGFRLARSCPSAVSPSDCLPP